ncbi:MAG: tetratricopeptide repeat protein, partial [Cyclobacteriaceae bacterium]|nr:tetratricopeptide repeat protein [Cyclobacteriaceae bacterium]
MKQITLIIAFISISFFSSAQSTEIDNLIRQGSLNEALELSNSLEKSIHKFNYLGIIYLQKGMYEEAKKNFSNALELHERDSERLVVARCYSNIAISEFALGNMDKSLEYHFRALTMREKEKSTADIAASFNDIGLAYFDVDPDKALDYYEKALAIYEELYDPMDDRIATAHTNIGIVYGKMALYGDAIISLQEALAIRKEKNGDKHAATAFVLSAIGRVYDNMNELEIALDYQQQALSIYQLVYGKKHPEIANTYNYIGNIKDQQKSFKEAVNFYHQAIIANTTNYDTDDVYTRPEINTNYYNGDLLLLSIQQKAEAFERLHFGKSLKLNDLLAAISHIEICDQLIDELRQQKTSETDKIALGNMSSEVYEDGIRMSLSVAGVAWKKKEFYEKAFYFSEKSKAAVLLDAIAETNAKSFANIPDELLIKELQYKTEIAYYQQKIATKPDKQKEEEYRNKLFESNSEYASFTKKLETEYPSYYNLK